MISNAHTASSGLRRCFVTDRAIRRRLNVEGVDREDREWILREHRDVAERVIREEIASARLLLPHERRLLSQPWREKRRDVTLPLHRRPGGSSDDSSPRRHIDEDYYLFGVWYYIVYGHEVMMMRTLTTEEAELLETVPNTLIESVTMKRIFREVCESSPPVPLRLDTLAPPGPSSMVRPTAVDPPDEDPSEETASRRQLRAMGILLKPHGSWRLFVMDDIPSVETLVRNAATWLRETYRNVLPDPLYVDQFSDPLREEIERRLGHLRLQPLPPVPVIHRYMVRQDDLPASALRWTKRLLCRSRPAGNALVTLVLPETARCILEIVDGSLTADWRCKRDLFVPGRVCDIRLPS